MYCSRCGAANPEGPDVRFCRACGAELAAVPPATYQLPPGQPPSLPWLPAATPSAVSSPATLAAPAEVGTTYGGFWIRLVAYVLDSLIASVGYLGVLLVAIALLALRLAASGREWSGDDPALTNELILLYVGLGLVFSAFYFVVLPVKAGATPGKLAVGYHIVGPDGCHIGYGRSTVRLLAQFPSTLVLYLGYVWIGLDAQKQGWHDKIAGTYVVRRELVRQRP